MGTDNAMVFSFPNEAISEASNVGEVRELKKPEPSKESSKELGTLNPVNVKNGVRKMDVMKMLAELKQEREHIEEAILTLERLARGRGKRRGRPPAWMKEVKRRGRPPGSKNKVKESAVA
jgi:hypothetical protein